MSATLFGLVGSLLNHHQDPRTTGTLRDAALTHGLAYPAAEALGLVVAGGTPPLLLAQLLLGLIQAQDKQAAAAKANPVT